jgi:hypothetical protein
MNRIQRKQTPNWQMPANAVFVGRWTRYGNPFSAEEYGNERSAALYREAMETMQQNNPAGYQDMLETLRGKDLVCWCAPNEICHADILIELAANL